MSLYCVTAEPKPVWLFREAQTLEPLRYHIILKFLFLFKSVIIPVFIIMNSEFQL